MSIELIVGIVSLVIIILIVWIIGGYNTLTKLRNAIHNSYSDIDVQMTMRMDLVESLVNTVKGYATHEKETLTAITDARTKFLSATTTQEKQDANNILTQGLKSVFAISEQYPDLKANTNFLQLQTELSDIENKIAAARRYYNATIKEYNNTAQAIPMNIVAGLCGFKSENPFFVAESGASKKPTVSF